MPPRSRFFVLSHAEARRRAAEAVRDAPEGHVVIVQPQSRTSAQNRHFHAICEDIAKSGHPWLGKPRDTARWKLLLVSGHTVATGGEVEIGEGLEGELVNLRESTALMSKRRGSSLIEYALAYCALHRIPTRPPPGYTEDT